MWVRCVLNFGSISCQNYRTYCSYCSYCRTPERGLFKSNLTKCLSRAPWELTFRIFRTISILTRATVGHHWVAAKGHCIKKCWLTAWWFGWLCLHSLTWKTEFSSEARATECRQWSFTLCRVTKQRKAKSIKDNIMRKDKSSAHGNTAKPTHYESDSYRGPTDTLFFDTFGCVLFLFYFCFVFLTATSWWTTPTGKNRTLFKSTSTAISGNVLLFYNELLPFHTIHSLAPPHATCKHNNTLPFKSSMYNPQVKNLRLKYFVGGNYY